MNQNTLLTSQDRLMALGYTQKLDRNLTLGDNVGVTMSVISPLMAVFILGLSPIRIAGTASIPGMIIFSIIAICNGLVLAELISQYPVSGGTYSCIKFSLPDRFSKIAGLALTVQSVLVTASIAMGIATYFKLMFPIFEQYNISSNFFVVIILIVSYFICIKNIGTSKKILLAILGIQLAILCAFIMICFLNNARSVGEVLTQLFIIENGVLKEVGLKTVFISIAPIFGVINGYESSLGLAEETVGESKNVSKAVVISAIGAALLITTTVLASAIAAPDLEVYLNSVSPFLYTAESVMGSFGKTIMSLGVQIASLGALFSVITYYSRVLYAMSRDKLYFNSLNIFLSKLSKKEGTPFAATSLLIIVSIMIAYTVSLENTVAGVGVLVAIIYMLTAVSSIVNRLKKTDNHRTFSMPFFPIPAILVILTALLVIYMQTLVVKLALLIFLVLGVSLGTKLKLN